MKYRSCVTALRSALGALWLLGVAVPSVWSASGVKVWEEPIVLPTYVAGDPEPNPMFYFGRASQGAEGRVYPYPLYDTLTGRKEDRTYRIVYLENAYVRIGVLPEIGGRVFEGIDKSNGYPFFYRQHVIKPALIGLIGAWISGGVEWNIPHHHRATTFIPVQYRLQSNPDGSKTVWVGELEVRHRMRWAVGYTLRPGASYLEASVRILNRTPVVNTMLCFANVAVHANEQYQVIFPPRTQYVTHHHKREFTTWPIATTRYGGWDFSAGVDVSWFTNHIAANSMFAWNYEDDFVAGYDHGRQAGLMSVADHHIVPGKKLWTWGNGPRGRMWDHILTDADGPYIELMVGAYSDNQPDYSWLQPYEVKSFEMYWYPFRGIGGAQHATLDAAVNLEIGPNHTAKLGFHTTAAHRGAVVRLEAGRQELLREKVTINPGQPYVKAVSLPAGVDPYALRASLSAEGRELVAYSPVRVPTNAMPDPVKPPPAPPEIATIEELYLTGLRIEQFHHPTLDPDPYWQEALRRDPADARVNTALGINYLKRARFAEAERFFRQALARVTAAYTTPKDAEPQYYLGVALKSQGRTDEAFDAFYQATWSAAWRAAAYYALAEIATLRGDTARALDLVNRSLDANALNPRAVNLKAALLRHRGQPRQALATLATVERRSDPLDPRCLAERWLATQRAADLKPLLATLSRHPATAAETAAEYLNAGLWDDGTAVLSALAAGAPEPAKLSPMVYYYLAYFAGQQGQTSKAAAYAQAAAELSPLYVFPFQAEAMDVLREAIRVNPRDARAPYYLGNLLFDWQPAEAMKLWEQSAALDPAFPIVHRNLAIAYSHQKQGNALDRAIASLEKAVALPDKYPLHFFELDELYEAAGTAPESRLALLEQHHDIVAQRDDALSREVALKVILGKYDDAIRLMTGRQYEVWEGGTLSVAEYWVDAHVLRGQQHLAAGRAREALADVQAAGSIPENLPSERRGSGARAAELNYWLGTAQAALGNQTEATRAWKAAESAEGAGDAQRYYQALALGKLGENDRAQALFRQLIETGNKRLQEGNPIDFFAAFGEQQSQRSKLATAHYLVGLGHLGLSENDQARAALLLALKTSPSHLGAKTLLARLE
jgi:tetratricopeptide (TPR) repeat protein